MSKSMSPGSSSESYKGSKREKQNLDAKIAILSEKINEIRKQRLEMQISLEHDSKKKVTRKTEKEHINKRFHHPNLEYVYGEVIYSPYLVKPLDPYPKETFEVVDELREFKRKGYKYKDIPKGEAPYDVGAAKKIFIKEVIQYHPSYLMTEIHSPKKSAKESPISKKVRELRSKSQANLPRASLDVEMSKSDQLRPSKTQKGSDLLSESVPFEKPHSRNSNRSKYKSNPMNLKLKDGLKPPSNMTIEQPSPRNVLGAPANNVFLTSSASEEKELNSSDTIKEENTGEKEYQNDFEESCCQEAHTQQGSSSGRDHLTSLTLIRLESNHEVKGHSGYESSEDESHPFIGIDCVSSTLTSSDKSRSRNSSLLVGEEIRDLDHHPDSSPHFLGSSFPSNTSERSSNTRDEVISVKDSQCVVSFNDPPQFEAENRPSTAVDPLNQTSNSYCNDFEDFENEIENDIEKEIAKRPDDLIQVESKELDQWDDENYDAVISVSDKNLSSLPDGNSVESLDNKEEDIYHEICQVPSSISRTVSIVEDKNEVRRIDSRVSNNKENPPSLDTTNDYPDDTFENDYNSDFIGDASIGDNQEGENGWNEQLSANNNPVLLEDQAIVEPTQTTTVLLGSDAFEDSQSVNSGNNKQSWQPDASEYEYDDNTFLDEEEHHASETVGIQGNKDEQRKEENTTSSRDVNLPDVLDSTRIAALSLDPNTLAEDVLVVDSHAVGAENNNSTESGNDYDYEFNTFLVDDDTNIQPNEETLKEESTRDTLMVSSQVFESEIENDDKKPDSASLFSAKEENQKSATKNVVTQDEDNTYDEYEMNSFVQEEEGFQTESSNLAPQSSANVEISDVVPRDSDAAVTMQHESEETTTIPTADSLLNEMDKSNLTENAAPSGTVNVESSIASKEYEDDYNEGEFESSSEKATTNSSPVDMPQNNQTPSVAASEYEDDYNEAEFESSSEKIANLSSKDIQQNIGTGEKELCGENHQENREDENMSANQYEDVYEDESTGNAVIKDDYGDEDFYDDYAEES